MKSLPVNKLEVGMVVARDVITSKGQVLLKKGINLDDYYIKIFERYGIDIVTIEDANKVKKHFSEDEITKLRYNIRQEKKKMFVDCIEDSFFNELLETSVDLAVEEAIDG